MGSSLEIPPVIPEDWNRLKQIIDKLRHLRLGPDSNPVFDSLTLDDLITGSITVKNSAGDIIFYVDDDEMYFTAETAVPIAAGVIMGPWLFWFTYASP